MHRTLVVASFTISALASSARTTLAQEPAIRDSVTHAPVDLGPVVDTASRKMRRDARDRTIENCSLRTQGPVGYVLPLFLVSFFGQRVFDVAKRLPLEAWIGIALGAGAIAAAIWTWRRHAAARKAT